MPFVQLKPAERSFIDMARDLLHFDAIALCEGPSDAELLKLVASEPEANLAITDCGGMRGVYEISRYVAVLARLSRKLKALGVLVNADEFRPADRARGLLNSLREHGLEVGELEPVCACLFRTEVEQRPLIVCVAGLGDVPVDKHCIEDHVLKAFILSGIITLDAIRQAADELRRLAHARCEEPKVSAKDVLTALGFEPLGKLRELLAERPSLVHEAFWALRRLVDLLRAP